MRALAHLYSNKKALTDNWGLPAEAETGFKSSDSRSAVAAAVSFIILLGDTRCAQLLPSIICHGDGHAARRPAGWILGNGNMYLVKNLGARANEKKKRRKNLHFR